ncbi:MAG: ABC transporter substrate-binding protein [Desulfobacteraceae bacterium]|nr:ABC transporter substrate-binding protein [Desulfobacteraceae bacterium]
MKKLLSKEFFSPKLLTFFLILPLCLGLGATNVSAKFIKGAEVHEYTDKNAIYGGTYRWVMEIPPRSLDPQHGTGSYSAVISNIVYNGLVRFDQFVDKYEPDLAESWRQIDDRTYEFKLHKGVRFHDKPPVNGREMTSADVKYSFDHMVGLVGKKGKAKRKFFFVGKLESVETPDKYTVIIKTNKPYATIMNYIAAIWFSIIPREAIEEWGDLRANAVGTGPFMMTEYVKGSHINFVKHEKYFKKGKPYLDGSNCKLIRTPASRLAAFLAGKLDSFGPQPQQVPTVLKEDPDSTVYELPGFYTRLLRTSPWIENKIPLEPPFDSRKVRQAIAHSIDKGRLLRIAWQDKGLVSVGMIPDAYKPWSLPASDQWEYNPEKAKKLLAEAGYPNGFSCELMTWNATYMTGPAQVIQDMLKKTGINVTINALEFSQYFNKAYRFKYDMALHITTAAFEPEEWLVPYFGQLKSSTYYKWSDHKLWDMIDKQQHIMDRQKRVAYVQDIQKYAMNEAMSQALFTTTRYGAYKPYVHRKIFLHESQAAMAEYTWMERH